MKKITTLTVLIILFFSFSCFAQKKIGKNVKKQNISINKKYYLGIGTSILGIGILRYASTDLYKKNMGLGMNVSNLGFIVMAGGTELTIQSLNKETYRNLYYSGLALTSLGFLMNFTSTKNEKFSNTMMVSGIIIYLTPGIIENLWK